VQEEAVEEVVEVAGEVVEEVAVEFVEDVALPCELGERKKRTGTH